MSNDIQRMNPEFEGEPTEIFTEEFLFDQVRTSAAQVSGTFVSHKFKFLENHHKALVAKVLGPGEQFIMHLALLPDGSRLHVMMLISVDTANEKGEDILHQVLETVELGDGNAITLPLYRDLAKNARGSQQPAAILDTVRDLIAAGEHQVAASELARLRRQIAAAIPGPRVAGNTARWAVYGISVENPDPKRWKLELHRESPWGSAIVLTEDESEGLLTIMVNDILVTMPAIKPLLDDPSRDTHLFMAIARQIAQEMDAEIKEQEFTTLHGRLAYQVTLAPAVGDLKVRFLLQGRGDYLVGIILMAKSGRFEQQVERYEAILRGRWFQLGR